MKTNQYTLATDGSNDSDLTKLNPFKVTSNLIDMCTTRCATTAYNFETIDS